ncbi:MAG: DUF58 domain-containing protein [Methylobacteriaceae bacterium]|nr:DUF58 domain-containing protein [Rhodoblastus sp.]MCC0005716.1 DUF58 domain-containing protein [Methylobacteriaceae bacterium]
MVDARLIETSDSAHAPACRQVALDLARRLPAALVAAKDLAASLMHGVHGRRRAGVGETFWQFRHFTSGEAAQTIDWRRSARGDGLFVREREWEAAHTLWLWMDLSPSMGFVSDLAREPKVDRALALGLAAADLLVRGGERVGLLGLSRALAARDIVDRLGEVLAVEASRDVERAELPPAVALGPRNRAILIGDFLIEPKLFAERLSTIAARGASGHMVMIADPVEETFPFAGHVELVDSDSPATLRLGRAESWRADYEQRLARHRADIFDVARAHGISVLVHRTDRPASEALIALRARLEEGGATGGRA